MSFSSLISEDLKSYRRAWVHHTGMQLATLSVLAATYTIVLFGFALSSNLKHVLTAWGDSGQMTVYLKDDLSDADFGKLKETLTGLDLVTSLDYVPREAATETFKTQMASYAPDLLTDADFSNPFPASFRLHLKTDLSAKDEVHRLETTAALVQGFPGVDDVSYGQSWVRNYSSFCSTLYGASGVLTFILLTGSLLVIGNSIRASISARRDEIAILELVGATAGMIRRPFIVEGLLSGATAASLALGVNFALVLWQKSVMGHSLVLSRLAPMMTFMNVGWITASFAIGALIGAFGAWLTIRRINDGWSAAQGAES